MNYIFELKKIPVWNKLILTSLFLICNISLQSQTLYWQRLTDFEGYVYDILYDGEQNLYFSGYEVSRFYVWRSSDLGENWTKFISPRINCLAIDSSGVLWGGNDLAGGIYKSTNRGNTWDTAYHTNEKISSLTVSGNNWIWAGTVSGKILHSSDNGNTWEVDSLTVYYIAAIAFNSLNHIFVGAKGKIYRSTDLGATWETVYSNSATYFHGIVIDDSNHIYADKISKILISNDNGNTWSEVPIPIAYVGIFMDKYHNFYVFGYRSADNCITWSYIGPVSESGGRYVFADSLIFAGTDEGVFLYDPTYQAYVGSNWFPLALGNKWQFNAQSDYVFSGNTCYYVERDTIISGKRYFLLQGDLNDWVRYDSDKNILYLRWNDSDYVVMDYELNEGSTFSQIMFNYHCLQTVTILNPYYLSIFDSTYYTKGHHCEHYGVVWDYDTTHYSEGLGETRFTHSVDGHSGFPGTYFVRLMIRAIINDSSGVRYYSDHIKPEITFQPVLLTNKFNIDWNIQVDHDYSFYSSYLNVNFIDSVVMYSRYSNGDITLINDPVVAENIPNSINYRIIYQLDSTLMKNDYAFYYQIYAVDKGIVPEHSTSPDTGYYKLVYDPTFVAVEEDKNIITAYSLEQNYPNPFNPSTTISYSLPERGKVRLIIYDALGREVRKLVDEEKDAGKYEIEFNADGLASGMYFYRLSAGERVISKKMILLK